MKRARASDIFRLKQLAQRVTKKSQKYYNRNRTHRHTTVPTTTTTTRTRPIYSRDWCVVDDDTQKSSRYTFLYTFAIKNESRQLAATVKVSTLPQIVVNNKHSLAQLHTVRVFSTHNRNLSHYKHFVCDKYTER